MLSRKETAKEGYDFALKGISEYTKVGYKVGDKTTVKDLLYGTMLPSGADAVLALAIHTSGSISKFVNLMNDKVDELGLDETDHQFLKAIIEKFNGGPVGIDAIASSIGEERGTIEDVYEPYLLQLGFITRTPRGRMVTEAARTHMSL